MSANTEVLMFWPVPGKENLYVAAPSFDMPAAPSIEYVREYGQVCSVSEDGTLATVGVKYGLVVSYCAVTLNPDGTIGDFMPRPINRYVQVEPLKPPDARSELFKNYEPPEG